MSAEKPGYLAYDWRVIPLETHSGPMNAALDESCMNAMAERKVKPTIRFYKWNPSAVCLGYFQALHAEVDVEACRVKGVEVFRRRTGGGATYLDSKGELTYSVIAPANGFSSNFIESYREVADWIITGLKTLAIDAEFAPINDIVVKGKKISGNAQSRRGGIALIHGTLLYDVDVDTMFSLLKVPDEKLKGKTIQAVKERVTSLKQHGVPSYEKAYAALHHGMVAGKKWHEGKWSAEEWQNAQILAREKYSNEKWTGQR